MHACVSTIKQHWFRWWSAPSHNLNQCWFIVKWEQVSVKFEQKFETFHSRKCAWKCRLQNGGHFVSALMCWWALLGEIAHMCMPQNTSDDESTLVKVTAGHQATIHYLNQCCPRSMSTYGVTGNNELALFPEARGSPTSEVMSRANGHTISEDYKTWWLFYNANNPTTSPQLDPEAMAGWWVCEVRRTDGRETPLNIVLLLYSCGKKIAAGKGQGQYVRQRRAQETSGLRW